MTQTFLRLSAAVCLLSIAAAFGVATYQMWGLKEGVNSRLDSLVVMSSHTFGQADRLLYNANQFVDDTYYDNYANVQTTGVLLREMSEVVREVREGLLPEITASLKESRQLIAEMKKEVGPTGAALREDLDRVGKLVGTLEEQVKAGSPKVHDTANELIRVLDDVGKLLENEHIAGTLANVDKTTAHLAGSSESVDIALRPLREKAKLLKFILMRAVGVVKIAINPF